MTFHSGTPDSLAGQTFRVPLPALVAYLVAASIYTEVSAWQR